MLIEHVEWDKVSSGFVGENSLFCLSFFSICFTLVSWLILIGLTIHSILFRFITLLNTYWFVLQFFLSWWNRYKKLLCTVDLTRDFFFSYSYNVMHSLQKNLSFNETGQIHYESMFVWNEFLTQGIRNNLKNTLWTVALVHGFFKQVHLISSHQPYKSV